MQLYSEHFPPRACHSFERPVCSPQLGQWLAVRLTRRNTAHDDGGDKEVIYLIFWLFCRHGMIVTDGERFFSRRKQSSC